MRRASFRIGWQTSGVIETSARLLQLLSLLQTRPLWTGPQLAERLEVSARTIRSDVDKLRQLGYPVHAEPGVTGGYRLGAGGKMPPLLLDDEEVIAVAVGVRTAAGVAGIEESSVRALAKLEQVLPSRLRHRIEAIQAYTVPAARGGPAVDPQVLTAIAAACRDRHRLRFDYRSYDETDTLRAVEPYRLVHTGRKWYLVGWDLDRGDWRTFRADRIKPRIPTGPTFVPRKLPQEDLSAYVSRGVDAALFHWRARVLVHQAATDLVQWMPAAVAVEAVDDRSCIVHAGAETPHILAALIVSIDAEFEVDGPPEVLAALRTIAGRIAASPGWGGCDHVVEGGYAG
jgi:predicted DNA-binding transcriptional regulator YafY